MFYLYLDTVKDKLNITPLYIQVLNRAKLGTLRLRVRLSLRDKNISNRVASLLKTKTSKRKFRILAIMTIYYVVHHLEKLNKQKEKKDTLGLSYPCIPP